MTSIPRLAFASIVLCLPLIPLQAQEEKTASKEAAERLDEMRGLLSPLRAFAIEDGRRVPAQLGPEPLSRWTDPTREFSYGSLWVWSRSGRPVAAVAVELYPDKRFGQAWSYEFVSLSAGPLEVEGGSDFHVAYGDMTPPRPDGSVGWAPRTAGIRYGDVPDAPSPGQTASERLRQMKLLAIRLSANEEYRKQTYRLRLLTHPVLRYNDGADGIVDGAIFVFANGTNPEVLVLLEARKGSEGTTAWRWAFAPLSRAETTVMLGSHAIWTHPVSTICQRDEPYFLARTPREAPSR